MLPVTLGSSGASMPRPNRDRVMVSFYLPRSVKAFLVELAAQRGETQADTLRAMLAYAKEHMPKGWRPEDPGT